MPFTINGIGTKIYGSRGNVRWGSCDAVEWFVILYLPLIPIQTIHMFNQSGRSYQCVPIHWSPVLVLRSFVGAWCWGFLLGGIVLVIVGLANMLWPAAAAGVCLAALFGLITWLLRITDQRTCNIRRVLGPHALGSCDPANLARNPYAADPRRAYGTATYAEAVDGMMRDRRYSQAMWAARLATALEDATLGEDLTDQILADAEVAEAVEQVRRDPRRWAEVMLTPAERAARQRRVTS